MTELERFHDSEESELLPAFAEVMFERRVPGFFLSDVDARRMLAGYVMGTNIAEKFRQEGGKAESFTTEVIWCVTALQEAFKLGVLRATEHLEKR